jgi:hypothetical protein
MEKRIAIVLDSGTRNEHLPDFNSEDEFRNFISELMTNLTRHQRGWLVLDRPYTWYRVERIAALVTPEPIPTEAREPMGFKLPT